MAKTTTNLIDAKEANCELYTAELQDRGLLEVVEQEDQYYQWLHEEGAYEADIEEEDDF
jgi:hypothetical protein